MTKINLIVLSLLSCITCLSGQVAATESTPKTCELCPAMALIQPAEYLMGSWKDRGYGNVEGPQHKVVFKQAFQIARKEVSIAQFDKFVAATGYVSEKLCNVYTQTKPWHVDESVNWKNTGFDQDVTHPVVCVSWQDTQAYINWLNTKTDRQFRLPSEAEWEYLAKFGGIDRNGSVTHEVANIGQPECCGGKVQGEDQWMYTAPSGSFSQDKFGIFDIRGNVWEWQADCYHENYQGAPEDGSARSGCVNTKERVVRGGGFADGAEYMDPEFRLPGKQHQGYFTVGFRLAEDVR